MPEELAPYIVARRALLFGAAAAARWPSPVRHGGAPAPPTPARPAPVARRTTALELRDLGWDVVILETRDRVGGRVHTLSAPFAHGLHAEAGGESIDEDHRGLQALISRVRVEHRASRPAWPLPTLDRLGHAHLVGSVPSNAAGASPDRIGAEHPGEHWNGIVLIRSL